jgi:hypothetical protein
LRSRAPRNFATVLDEVCPGVLRLLNPSLGQVYFNIATASIIANALAN